MGKLNNKKNFCFVFFCTYKLYIIYFIGYGWSNMHKNKPILIFLFISFSVFRRSYNFNYLYKYFSNERKIFFYKIFNKPLYIAIFIILTQIIFFKNFYLKVNFSNYMSIRLYESINLLSLIFLMLYLLLTLICVVKLVKFEYGPLIKRLYKK